MKKERDETKAQLVALKQAKAPIVEKIQQIEEQLKPIEAQIKNKVKNDCLCVFVTLQCAMLTVKLQQLHFKAANMTPTCLLSPYNVSSSEF